MDPELKRSLGDAIRSATGEAFVVRSLEPAPGGCIHRSWILSDGARRYFAKTDDLSLGAAFAAEAEGLQALAAAGARVPQPVASGSSARFSYLVLEHLALGRGDPAAFADLGRMLALVHAVREDRYGWPRDNFIGSTPQANAPSGDWAEFWRERRLRPQLEWAAREGHGSLARRGERLCAEVHALLQGHGPAASLLHGDLWSGNAGFLANGTPVLFDPAAYHGDRETDLAMTELFGGFPPAFYAAYREAAPLDPGYETRRTLYNLYHVLNHAHLFGGAYAAQAGRMIEELLAEAR